MTAERHAAESPFGRREERGRGTDWRGRVRAAAAGMLAAAFGAEPAAASVLDLQDFAARTDWIEDGTAWSLLDLNPSVGRWYLLSRGDGTPAAHLDTGGIARLSAASDGMSAVSADGTAVRCPAAEAAAAAKTAKPAPYLPVCGGKAWVRRTAAGYKTLLEGATDLLRRTGGVGEGVINFYKDNFQDTAKAAAPSLDPAGSPALDGPPAASISPAWSGRTLSLSGLGLPVGAKSAVPGAWLSVKGAPGVFASAASAEAMEGWRPLEASKGDEATGREGSSMIYLVAYDLDRFSLDFAVGTDHPKTDWSDRPPGAREGPGPDGFASIAPLERSAVVPPWASDRLAGTFSGGFKREHGAFKYGPFAEKDHGTHYGFAEGGVVLSRLQVGLSTLFQRRGDPRPQLRTWTSADAKAGSRGLLFARQNGVPLIQDGGIGSLTRGGGNWSGSNEKKTETMRSAACVSTAGGGRWLVYALFTSSTPPTMAAVLKAYGCAQAMHLDMNAPVLTYAASYGGGAGGGARPWRLYEPMAEGDPKGSAKFAGAADTRDFFYLVRR